MVVSNQRAFNRKKVEAPLQFSIPGTDALAVTRLFNYCPGGLYFESHLPMTPDKETTVVIPDLLAEHPAPGAYAGYYVRIRWCNSIAGQRALAYGIGAAFLERNAELPAALAIERHTSECDLCDRVMEEGSVCRVDGTRCLCLPCYKHLEKIPSGALRNAVWRFIDRNVI
jgi:hypothetical protein